MECKIRKGYLCLVIRFVRDRYARAKRQEVVSAKKKFQKKIPKKKSTNKHNLMAAIRN